MVKFGIGQAVRRVEDRRFLLGMGQYVDDVSMPNQVYSVAIASPHANARIKKLDVSKAKAAPGVLLVLTGADAVADGLAEATAQPMPEHVGAAPGFRTFLPV